MLSLGLFPSSFILMTSMLSRVSSSTCNRPRHLAAPPIRLHCRRFRYDVTVDGWGYLQ
uniref:Uncharacterized protein n=1 Tax=Daphnia magna TaxID=35525 RepID=A0A0P5YF77_9CRUS